MKDKPLAKTVRWIGASKVDLREMPEDIQWEIGFALYEAQIGRQHPVARRMSGNLRAVTEMRVNDAAGIYRAMYTVEMKDVVYVLDVFQKRSKSGLATPKRDLDRIWQRLKRARMDYEEKQSRND